MEAHPTDARPEDGEESALISLGTTEEDARRGEMTKEELEEHMMVLAIQAAHVAAQGAAGKEGKVDLKGIKDTNLLGLDSAINAYGDTSITSPDEVSSQHSSSSQEKNQTKKGEHLWSQH